MDAQLRQKLEKKYQEKLDEAAKQLLDGDPPAQVAQTTAEVEQYFKLLASDKPRSKEKYWAVGVAIFCILTAGFMWSIRVPNTKFLLHAQCDLIHLQLAKKWSNGDESFDANRTPTKDEAEIKNADEIKIAGRPCDTSLTINEGNIQLTKLVLGAKTELEITARKDYLELYSSKGPIEGVLGFAGPVKFAKGGEQCGKNVGPNDPPEMITFSSSGQGRVPTSLKILPAISWPLRNLEVDLIDFSKETVPGSGEFETTIKKGTITLYDTARAENLQEGDRLKLEGVQGGCQKVWVENGINVICELTAKEILLGPKGAEKNLVPSLLDYLYYKKSLAFLWSVVTFLCGTLWGVRQVIFRTH